MKDDPHLWTRDHNLSAELVYSVEHRAIPPVLDELGKHFGEVRTRTVYPTPHSGSTTTPDWDFIATLVITFTAAGGVEFARHLLGQLAGDAYSGLRRAVMRSWRRRWALRRVKRGVIIRIGSHRFVFDQTISDHEFKRRLRSAQKIVDRSPTAMLEPDDPEDEWRPWLWHKGKWRTAGVRLAQAVGEEPRALD